MSNNTKELAYRLIEGTNTYPYLTNLECDNSSEFATAWFYNPNTKSSYQDYLPYKKFLFMRDFDALPNFFRFTLNDAKENYKKYISLNKETYINQKIEYEVLKLLVAKTPKGFLLKMLDLKDEDTLLFFKSIMIKFFEEESEPFLEDKINKFVEKASKASYHDKFLYKEETISKIKERFKETLFNLNSNDILKSNSDVEDYIETHQEKMDTLSDEIDKYEQEHDRLKRLIDKYQSIVENDISSIPTMEFIEEKRRQFNNDLSLKDGYKIIITPLTKLINEKTRKSFDRLTYGYPYLVETDSPPSYLYRFFREYVGIDAKKELARNMDLFLTFKNEEMFLIHTGTRFYKGINTFKDLKRVTLDLETTGLYAAKSVCKCCGHQTNLVSLQDVPAYCENKLPNGDKCLGAEFTIIDNAQIFAVSLKENNKESIEFVADINDDDKVNIESEKQLIKDIFDTINQINPETIETYNGEFFDSNFLLTRIERLKLRVQPIKCPKCNTKPLDDKFKEKKLGLLKPELKNGKVYKFICDCCNFEFEKTELNNIVEFSKKLKKPCVKCNEGFIVRGKTMYGCNNLKCDVRHSFESYESFISDFKGIVDNYIYTSRNYKYPIKKKEYYTTLKLGGEVEQYKATKIYGRTVLDGSHAVRAAKAIKSDIKMWSLKYISNFKPLKAKTDRTYIAGNNIFKFHKENKYFLNTSDNIYVQIPEEYQDRAQEFLELFKSDDFSKTKYYNENIIVPFKGLADDEDLVDGNFIRTKFSNYKEKYVNDISIVTGKQLIKQYVSDDVVETEKVANYYQDEKFNSVKFFPMVMQDYVVAGTASSLNLIYIAMQYTRKQALSHSIDRVAYVGGLSRAFIVGFAERIYKLDYSSLYPSLEMALEMITRYVDFAPDIFYILQYGFENRFYWKHRTSILQTKESKRPIEEAYGMYLKFIKEDGIEQPIKEAEMLWEKKDYAKLTQIIEVYEKVADSKQNALKVKFINSLFGAIFSDIALFGSDIVGNYTTAAGRMFLRSGIFQPLILGCKPTVADTDGFNLAVPEYITKDFKGNSIEPIKFEDLTYKGKKGINAIAEYFNSHNLPKLTDYMKLSLDEVDDSNIIAAKKNYLNYKDGKVKAVGNSFKSSNIQDYIKNFFDSKIIELFRTKDLKKFLNDYYEERKRIVKGSLTISEVSKKKKVKKTVEEYDNRGTTKTGNMKSEEVHMELIKKHGLKPSMGELIYYINIGNKANTGDNDYFVVKHKIDGKKIKCDITDNTFVIQLKDENNVSLTVKKFFSSLDKAYAKAITVNKNTEKNIVGFNELLNEYKTIYDMSEIDINNYKDFRLSLNDKSEVTYNCKKYTILGDDFYYEKEEKYASIYVEYNDIEKTPNKVIDYNFLQADKSFVMKIKPLNVIFPSNLRDKVFNVLNNSIVDREEALRVIQAEQDMLNKLDFSMTYTINDTMEELFTMEDKEHRFWSTTGLNPKMIFPKIKINKPLIWDEYNKFVDRLELLLNYKGKNVMLKRDRLFCGEGEYLVEEKNNKYQLLKKENGVYVLKHEFEKNYFNK